MRTVVIRLAAVLTALMALAGCAAEPPAETAAAENAVYQQITAEEAKAVMDSEEGYILLDVRTQSEYEEGHIPGAVLLPHDMVALEAEKQLPDKDQKILVYCRSGNRSKQAASALAELGYTDVLEFGGIIDWPYEVEQ